MPNQTSGNTLFPVFLKLENLNLLLVGGGNVGLEKLTAILTNSPKAKVQVVAKQVLPELRILAKGHHVTISERAFEATDLDNQNIIILATNDVVLDAEIKELVGTSAIVNVADKPELCDFYLGSIVKKGDLKIGISTNGKSPTIAKRVRELLQAVIPNDVHNLLTNMSQIRNQLKGDFASKVNTLNKLTESWSNSNDAFSSQKNRLSRGRSIGV